MGVREAMMTMRKIGIATFETAFHRRRRTHSQGIVPMPVAVVAIRIVLTGVKTAASHASGEGAPARLSGSAARVAFSSASAAAMADGSRYSGTPPLHRPDSKTGARTVSMTSAASDVLKGLPRTPGSPWVFSGKKKGTRLVNLNDSWDRVRRRAGLDGVRLHDLRHSFASRALALGESLPMIGKLLGHTQVQTTARYAHLQRDSIKASASRIADSIGADIRM